MHCQQHKRVHFVSFTVCELKRVSKYEPGSHGKNRWLKGAPLHAQGLSDALGMLEPYLSTLLFPLAGSLPTPIVTVEGDCHQLWGTCHCSLLFLRLGMENSGSWNFCELLNCLSCHCLVLHGLKALRVETTEHFSGP